MTLTEMATELCNDVGGDTSDSDLMAKLIVFIKGALRQFPLYIRNKFLIDTKTGTLSSGASTMTIPSGLIEPRDVYYITSSVRVRIKKLTYDKFNEAYQVGGSGAPEYYRIVGDTVEFSHAADQDYTIYFEGKCSSVDSLSASSTFTGSDEVVEVVKNGAKEVYYLSYTEDNQLGPVFSAKFRDGLQKLDEQYMISDMPRYVEES